MPKIDGEIKTALISTKVTRRIREIITQQASREGITTSEWLRKLIIKELKHENLLSMVFKTPKV
ncbi:hypothetical protein DRO61_00410 [Candidatus Bathyarchaeota archaeon]|jgi:hypothetical protein|nr:MAG: hypothetical protein DRO61_00410 [Candidatus Bathyarchaeota archaeon]